MNSNVNFFTRAFLFSTLVLTSIACDIDGVSPEPGSITTENRSVADFNSLDIESGIRVTVTQGNTESTRIEAREGYQPYILTEVRNNTLRIRVDNRLKSRRGSEIRAYVTMRTLTNVWASGGSRVTSDYDFKPDQFTTSLSGGSYLRLPISTNSVSVDASGGSEAEIAGTAQTLTVDDISGGSKLLTADLRVTNCTLEASGGSTADVNVSEELRVRASGGSVVRYKGSPRITQNVSGGSRVSSY